MSDRIPPHDLDAEAAVISAILLDTDRYDVVGDFLEPGHFYADANRLVYEAIVDLRMQGKPADIVLIAGWLRDRGRLDQVGGTPYLAQLSDATPAIANILEHARAVVEKWRLRQLIATAQSAVAHAYANVENAQEFCEKVEEEIGDIAHRDDRVREELARTIIGRSVTRLADARARGETVGGIPTGFTMLDRLTGGLFPSDLTIVAGRPGLGKTSFAQSIACNVARPRFRGDGSVKLGHAVLFASLEQPRSQLAERLAGHEGEFDVGLWRRPRVTDGDWQKMVGSFGYLEHLPIYIDDTVAISLRELRAKIRRVKREVARGIEHGDAVVPSLPLGVVVVDYLQLMKGDRRGNDSREREVAGLSAGLKNLAKQEDVAIVALSQLNRAVEAQKNKRPELKDLRESGAIEQDADNVLMLYRESYYDPGTTEKLTAECIVAKQRNGPTGVVELVFREKYTRYYNLESDGEWSEYDQFDVVP